jgi:hypothetical protein
LTPPWAAPTVALMFASFARLLLLGLLLTGAGRGSAFD